MRADLGVFQFQRSIRVIAASVAETRAGRLSGIRRLQKEAGADAPAGLRRRRRGPPASLETPTRGSEAALARRRRRSRPQEVQVGQYEQYVEEAQRSPGHLAGVS
jgi:hypothetical protein